MGTLTNKDPVIKLIPMPKNIKIRSLRVVNRRNLAEERLEERFEDALVKARSMNGDLIVGKKSLFWIS